MWVLIDTENAYHANTRWHRQEEGSSPTDSRGSPTNSRVSLHHVCGVALYSVWHLALCGEWILEVAPIDSRGGPHHVCGVALCSVWGINSRGGPHGFKRWPSPRVWCDTLLCVALCSVWGIDCRGGPHRFRRWHLPRVWSGTLLRVALSSIKDPSDASTIVGY